MVKGIHDLAVRFSRVLQPGSGRRDRWFCHQGARCVRSTGQIVSISSIFRRSERSRLIDAEWQQPEGGDNKERYSTEIQIFANNRIGMFVDISKVFTERQIDITSMNVRTSKQGKATIVMTFDIHGIEELNRLTDKLRQIEGVLDIERTAG